MPGPVSDSYDPEFGTGENSDLVRGEVMKMRDWLTYLIGSEKLEPIVDVCRSEGVEQVQAEFTTRNLRILRFAVNRALESL